MVVTNGRWRSGPVGRFYSAQTGKEVCGDGEVDLNHDLKGFGKGLFGYHVVFFPSLSPVGAVEPGT